MWNRLGRQTLDTEETGRFSATWGHLRPTIRQKWMVLNKGPHIGGEGGGGNEERSPGSIGVLAKQAKKLSSHLGLRLRETLWLIQDLCLRDAPLTEF